MGRESYGLALRVYSRTWNMYIRRCTHEKIHRGISSHCGLSAPCHLLIMVFFSFTLVAKVTFTFTCVYARTSIAIHRWQNFKESGRPNFHEQLCTVVPTKPARFLQTKTNCELVPNTRITKNIDFLIVSEIPLFFVVNIFHIFWAVYLFRLRELFKFVQIQRFRWNDSEIQTYLKQTHEQVLQVPPNDRDCRAATDPRLQPTRLQHTRTRCFRHSATLFTCPRHTALPAVGRPKRFGSPLLVVIVENYLFNLRSA